MEQTFNLSKTYSCGQGINFKEKEESIVLLVNFKIKCVYNYCVQSCVFRLFLFRPHERFAIDWSLIININRLIDIDWYRLISIVIE